MKTENKLTNVENDLTQMAAWVTDFYSSGSDIDADELKRLEAAVETLRGALMALEDCL